jgi:hypothetical protein
MKENFSKRKNWKKEGADKRRKKRYSGRQK